VVKPKNPLHTFPRNFPVDGEAANLLKTRYGLVVYVADLLRTCHGEVANDVNLLRTCYGETGVMDFCL